MVKYGKKTQSAWRENDLQAAFEAICRGRNQRLATEMFLPSKTIALRFTYIIKE
jgi:hypothetical protein